MAMQELVVLVNEDVLHDLEELAQRRQIAREQVASELLQEALRRANVRSEIFAEMERRQTSPEWNAAFERIKQFQSQLPDISEGELDADITDAVQHVRSQPKE